jgi:hypothetical protein
MFKYKLAVGALFKNESHALKEWLDHYIIRGADHFFLINDKSTDSFQEILLPYQERGLITLFNTDTPYYLGRQRDLYNTYILPHVTFCEWLLMVDLDEFVWSPQSTNFVELLKQFNHIGQFQFEHTLFGSNGHLIQPESIVKGFTKRHKDLPTHGPVNYKYFIQGKYEFTSLNVHHATFKNLEYEKTHFKMFGPDWWCNNHYWCQSRDFWNNVKCVRGDSDAYRKRTPEHFQFEDFNDVEDTGLFEQNLILGLFS